MNELSSNEVPQKFTEWLLNIGCYTEIVPSVEKVAEKCRGQYYMVWRSLMAKVEHKDVIKNKRLQVFSDDMRKAQKKNIFNETDSNTVVPEELKLWQQHTELKLKVADAEAKVKKEKEETLHHLTEKANSKLCQRYTLQKQLQDRQRQALLLQKLADDLKDQKAKLLETKKIAESLCEVTEDNDIEGTIDKCVASLTQQVSVNKMVASVPTTSAGNTTAGAVYTTSDSHDEELMSALGRCRGDLLFRQLLERRAALCDSMPAGPHTTANTRGVQSVVCHTASLHCSLALEAMKNKILCERVMQQLHDKFMVFTKAMPTAEIDEVINACNVAYFEARVASLQRSCEEIEAGTGMFATQPAPGTYSAKTALHNVDKAIESKRDELKRLITSVAAIERKTQNVRERLLSLFNSLHESASERDRLGASSLLAHDTSMSALRRFYEEQRESRRGKANLSLDLDGSDSCSYNPDNRSPTFTDELKLYLNKFSLEKNRQLVLESGEKVWVFKSIASSLQHLVDKWQSSDVTSLLCPSVSLQQNLRRLLEEVRRKDELEMLQGKEGSRKFGREIDVSSLKEEEEKALDRIKKRLNDNLLSLVKVEKTLDCGIENLHIWESNDVKKYISEKRKVNGITYAQYEKAYINSI